MRLPTVTITVCGEAVEVLYAGLDKGAALSIAKDTANKPVEAVTEVRVLSAQSVAWRRQVRPATAPVPVEEIEAEQDGDEPDDSSQDASEIREKLKAKGVKVPPRIGSERLIALAIEHGVE